MIADKRAAWEQLSLGRHGFIEASAGTGKTYAIERLVLRMLTRPLENPWQEPVRIDQILIVTYTEKAAGELRTRIRRIIEDTLRALREGDSSDTELKALVSGVRQGGLPDAARHLQDCLTRFDSAAIHTIHSFCHRCMNGYSFESGAAMGQTPCIAGEPATEAALSLLRSEIKAMAGRSPAVLNERLEAWGISSVTGLQDLIADIAAKYNPARGDRLQPELLVSSSKEAEELLVKRIRRYQTDFCVAGTVHPFVDELDKIKKRFGFNGSSLNARKKRLSAFLGLSGCNDALSVERWLRPWMDADIRQELTVVDNNKNLVTFDTWAPAIGHYNGHTLSEAIEAVEDLKQLTYAYVWADLYSLIEEATRRIDRIKHRDSIITYDDMIFNVYRSLATDTSPIYKILRQQFRYGIIDEFQDTNSLQWGIFKRLFVDGTQQPDSRDNYLYVVGDPKQSIFSFQGSDIAVYYQAKATLGLYGAQVLSLGTSYRHSREMVQVCNRLFDGEWFGGGKDIIYEPVDAGKPAEETAWYADDCAPQFRSPLVLRSFDGEEEDSGIGSSRPGKEYALATWICACVRYVTTEQAGHTPMRIPDENGRGFRNLRLGDICILVEKHHEALHVMDLMRQYGVAYTKQRNVGLFKSDECLYLCAVLDAIDKVKDTVALKKAFITPFFGFSPRDLLGYTDMHDGCWTQQVSLIREWVQLRNGKQWPRLFSSLYSDTAILAASSRAPDGKLKIAALRQLRSYCLRYLIDKRRSLAELINRLRALYRQEMKEVEEEDLFQRETDGNAVKIMTMHSSKGLEFPVVFIASGKSRQRHGMQYYEIRNKDGGIDFWFDKIKGKSEYEQQRCMELRRLYYVALTRAKYQLFLPLWDSPEEKNGDPTSASSLFLSAACHDMLKTAGISGPVSCVSLDRCSVGVFQQQHPVVQNQQQPIALSNGADSRAAMQHRIRELSEMPVFSRAAVQRSYSGIVRLMQHLGVRMNPGADEEAVAVTVQKPDNEALPPGAPAGNALHRILERTEFCAWTADIENLASKETAMVAQCLTTERLLPSTDSTTDAARLKSAIAYVRNSLNAVITDPVDPARTLTLCSLGTADRLTEAEFHFTFSRDGTLFPSAGEVRGWVLGYIDLLFAVQDRYYILDWKSNWIANNDYSPTGIAENMRMHQYDMQYKVYSLALHRWLQVRLGNAYDVRKNFGGVIYVYLRGTQAGSGETGIWANCPSTVELEEAWPQELKEKLARTL